MNYAERYKKFIADRKYRELDETVTYQRHHVIPRFDGGTDHPSNLIYLSRREHLHAHLLLWMSNKDNSEYYWSIQWFHDLMSKSILKMYTDKRSAHRTNQDRSYEKETWFRQQQSISVRGLWSNPDYRNHMILSKTKDNYREVQSNSTKAAYETGKKSKNQNVDSKSGRFQSRPIMVDDQLFDSISEAARHYGLSVKAAFNRTKSKNYPTWVYV